MVTRATPQARGPICWMDNCGTGTPLDWKTPSGNDSLLGSTASGKGGLGFGAVWRILLPTGKFLLFPTISANSSGSKNWNFTLLPRIFKERHTFFALKACITCSLPMALIACCDRCSTVWSGTPCFASSLDKALTRAPEPPDPHTTGHMQHVPSNNACTKLAFMLAWESDKDSKSSGRSAATIMWPRNAMAAAPHKEWIGSLRGKTWSTASRKSNCTRSTSSIGCMMAGSIIPSSIRCATKVRPWGTNHTGNQCPSYHNTVTTWYPCSGTTWWRRHQVSQSPLPIVSYVQSINGSIMTNPGILAYGKLQTLEAWLIMCVRWNRISSSPHIFPFSRIKASLVSLSIHWCEKQVAWGLGPAVTVGSSLAEETPGSLRNSPCSASPEPQIHGLRVSWQPMIACWKTDRNPSWITSASSLLVGNIEPRTQWCK